MFRTPQYIPPYGASVLRRHTAHQVEEIPYVDLVVSFIGAKDLPPMDPNGLADPYFIADLDKKIFFT